MVAVKQCFLIDYNEFSAIVSDYCGYKVEVGYDMYEGVEAVMAEGKNSGMIIHDINWCGFREYLAHKYNVKKVMLNPSSEMWMALLD